MNSVQLTVSENLCISCGICSAVCPKNCIGYCRQNGLYIPQIDHSMCINCGICSSVCPGISHRFKKKDPSAKAVIGNVLFCRNAWSKNAKIRFEGASGGVITTLIHTLLEQGCYSGVFCVDSYDYHNQLSAQYHNRESYLSSASTAKSRYLPVSHKNTIEYIKAHPNEKIIIIGTSCALRGIDAAIEKLKLSRENYLFIGLFCDKVFNYNVLQYFENTLCDDLKISTFHFKNKESGGWPGDMKFFPVNGIPFYRSKDYRGAAKAYFMPERCLYCVDKLNTVADISIGDNYTNKSSTIDGSNSVIIRTDIGASVWNQISFAVEQTDVDIAEICKAQDIEYRLNNLCFAALKEKKSKEKLCLNEGVQPSDDPIKFERLWISNLKKIKAGGVYYDNPRALSSLLKNERLVKTPIIRFIIRGYYYIRRKIKRGKQ